MEILLIDGNIRIDIGYLYRLILLSNRMDRDSKIKPASAMLYSVSQVELRTSQNAGLMNNTHLKLVLQEKFIKFS